MDAPRNVPERYVLDTPLGHGSVGTVWRAHDTVLDRPVAVKVLALAGGGNPNSYSRFVRESEAAAAINDRHVVQLLDAGSADRTAWLVMELLPGPSVAELLTSGPLGWHQGLAIAEHVALGLAAAHDAGVVHRDVKPGNVVMRGDEAVIVDFGIARLIESIETTRTATGVITGTAAYLAPEQALGQPVTSASDLYSFGCLLMAMFTGTSPFTGDLAVTQALAHVGTPAPRLSERRPDAPPALDELVAHLLHKDPAHRPDARTAASELARLRDDPDAHSTLPPSPDADATATLTIGALPRRALVPAHPPHRRRRRWVPFAAALALLVFGGALGLALLPGLGSEPGGPGAATATVPSGTPTASATASGTPPSASPTPTDSPGPTAPASTGRAPVAPLSPAAPAPRTSQPQPPPAAPPAPTVPPAPRPIDAARLARVSDAIGAVGNPGGRQQLQRAWATAVDGITADNAAGRVATFRRTLAGVRQPTDAERAAIETALGGVRG